MNNEIIAHWVTNQTDTYPEDVTVLYNDGQTALVKWPREDMGWSGYTPPRVYRYNLELLRNDRVGAVPFGESVWNSSKHGRLTSAQIEGLVIKLGLNPVWISPKQKQKSGRQPATIREQIRN